MGIRVPCRSPLLRREHGWRSADERATEISFPPAPIANEPMASVDYVPSIADSPLKASRLKSPPRGAQSIFPAHSTICRGNHRGNRMGNSLHFRASGRLTRL